MMRRSLYGPALILVIAALAGTAVTAISPSPPRFWLTLLWGAWGLSALWALTRPTFSLPFAAVLSAMLVFIVLPATGHVLSGRTDIAGNDYTAGTIAALRLSVAAQCALLAGAILARAFWSAPTFVQLRTPLSSSRLDRGALAAMTVGVLGVLLFVEVGKADLRQFLAFTNTQGYGAFAVSAAGTRSGYFVALQFVAGLALVLVALRFTSASRAARTLPLIIAAIATLLLLGGGQRGPFFVPLLAAALVWFKTTPRKLLPRRLAISGLLVLLAVSAVVSVARGAAGQRTITAETVLTAPVAPGSDLFAPLAGLAETVPSQVSYLAGSSYLETFVFPVPRALWHSKPHGAVSTLISTIDPGNSGIAFAEFGEMYANFGLVGVLIGSVLFGLFVEWLWIRLAATASVRETVLISVVFSVLLQLFVRGSTAPMLATFGGLLLATLILCRPSSTILGAERPTVHSAQPRVHTAVVR